MFFHYLGFSENSTSKVYLVKVNGYYEDSLYYARGYGLVQAGGGDLQGAFLSHVSEEYFKGPHAYAQWLENRKNPPKEEGGFLQRLKCGIEH